MRHESTVIGTVSLLLAASGSVGCGDDGATGTGSTGIGGGGSMTSMTTMSMTTTSTMPDTTGDNADTTAASGQATASSTGEAEMTTEDSTGSEPASFDAFRFTSLLIRDPHFFDTLVCSDITQTVNDQFADGLSMDDPEDPDGLIDLSLLLVFRPASQQDGVMGDVDFANGSCTVPVETTECSLREGTVLYPAMFTNIETGLCHQAEPSHLGDYEPAPGITSGPCFTTDAATVVISTSFDLPLEDAIISAQYSGDDQLVEGTIRGFLTASAAEATTLPDDLPVVGGSPVSALLKGGEGSSFLCSGDDTDGDGWWFYVDFTAERVPWSE